MKLPDGAEEVIACAGRIVSHVIDSLLLLQLFLLISVGTGVMDT